MDKQPDTLQDAFQQSAEQFRDQFNPQSQNFHGGDPTPVPLGGERVPQSMPTVYPEQIQNLNEYINQPEQQPQNFGAEYQKVQDQREVFLNIKKLMVKLTQSLEAIQRHKETFQQKGDKQNENHQEIYQKNVNAELLKLKQNNQQLLTLVDSLDLQANYKERYAGFKQMILLSEQEFQSKDQLGEYFLNLKNFSQKAFADSNKLMDQMKLIKKQQQQGQQSTQQQQQTNPKKMIDEEEKKQ